MVKKRDVVKQALSSGGLLPYVPRGELFIDMSFLNWMPLRSEGYFEKFKEILFILELDMVGISSNEKELITKKDLEELEDIFLVYNVNGPFSFYLEHLGFIETLKASRKDRGKILALGETYLKYFKETLPLYRDLGFSGIAIADDIAGNNGAHSCRDDFEALLKPFYLEMVKAIKTHNLYVFFHSDGNLERYIKDFVNIGFDCLYTFDGQAGMDVYKIMETIQKEVCFMGHIDLYEWDLEKIEKEIKKAEEMFLRGGMIIGSTSGLSKSLSLEKVLALYPGLKRAIKDEAI